MKIHKNVEEIRNMLVQLQFELTEMPRLDKKTGEIISSKLDAILNNVQTLDENVESLTDKINSFL